jgi:hypothetical protein
VFGGRVPPRWEGVRDSGPLGKKVRNEAAAWLVIEKVYRYTALMKDFERPYPFWWPFMYKYFRGFVEEDELPEYSREDLGPVPRNLAEYFDRESLLPDYSRFLL